MILAPLPHSADAAAIDQCERSRNYCFGYQALSTNSCHVKPCATRIPESPKSIASQTIVGVLLTAALCSAGSLAFVTQPPAE